MSGLQKQLLSDRAEHRPASRRRLVPASGDTVSLFAHRKSVDVRVEFLPREFFPRLHSWWQLGRTRGNIDHDTLTTFTHRPVERARAHLRARDFRTAGTQERHRASADDGN